MADFDPNPRGGLNTNRESLHASAEYRRQVSALEQMKESEMAEKMTLPEVRDKLRKHGVVAMTGNECFALADAIDAHLAQPAQAVDALQDAIFQIAERLGEVRDPDMDDMSWHTQLIARAQYLANAQSVDVLAIRAVIARLHETSRIELRVWSAFAREQADKLTRAIGNAQADD